MTASVASTASGFTVSRSQMRHSCEHRNSNTITKVENSCFMALLFLLNYRLTGLLLVYLNKRFVSACKPFLRCKRSLYKPYEEYSRVGVSNASALYCSVLTPTHRVVLVGMKKPGFCQKPGFYWRAGQR